MEFYGFGSSKALTLQQAGCGIFSSILEHNDLICFSETWRDPIDTSLFTFNDNFSEFHEPGCRNHLGGRPSGGLSLFVRKSILEYFSIVFSDSYHSWWQTYQDRIWLGTRFIHLFYLYSPEL